jgi:hypothetical protein
LDTVKKITAVGANSADNFTSKLLDTVVVTGNWRDQNNALNKRYVISKEFAPIEHYSFDLRDPALLERSRTVADFIYHELPRGWAQSSLLWDQCRDGIQYYVDEQRVSGETVATQPLRNFAYVKLFQDLHPPCPAIVLYTRKGNDLKDIPGSMRSLVITGYDRPLIWSTPDGTVYLWNPYVDQNSYRFKVPIKAFKVVIAGIMREGSPFYFEKIIRE